MKWNLLGSICGAFIVLLFGSCSEYQKLLNSDDTAQKYRSAEEFYDKAEYRKANRLLEQIVPKYRGKPQAERIIFFFADSYFKTKSYILSAYQYENFIKSYPKSQRIEEAYFKAAKCYYFLSPNFSLDEEDTYTAIDKLQIFINLYPNSEFAEEANQMILELQTKLEQKDLKLPKGIIPSETMLQQSNHKKILLGLIPELNLEKKLWWLSLMLPMKLL